MTVQTAEPVFNFVPRASCQLCGCSLGEFFDSIRWGSVEFRWEICQACAFVYMNPVPDAATYVEFYKQDFWEVKVGAKTDWQGRKEADPDEGQKKALDLFRQIRIPQVDFFLDGRIKPGDRVLEIGCAFGETLAHLHARHGAEVFGIEPGQRPVQYLKERYPFLTLIAGSAEEVFEPTPYDGTFDCIIFSHCLENITEQSLALQAARRLLKDSGVLYMETPNLFGGRALNPYHPICYSPASVLKMLGKHRFRVVKFEGELPPRNLFKALRARNRFGYITLLAEKAHPALETSSLSAAETVALYRASRRALKLYTRIKELRSVFADIL